MANDLLKNELWLKTQYKDELKSGVEIARELGCDKSTVYKALKRLGIKKRAHTSRYPLLNNKAWLKKAYLEKKLSTHEIAELSGSTPGNVYSALISLGVPLRTSSEGLEVKFPEGRTGDKHPNWKGGRIKCQKPNPAYKNRLGEKAPNWKGGRNIAAGGYIYIHQPEHPNSTKNGYVMEHRLVMEKVLNRYLDKKEIVHHKNGDRQDNRPENLEVVSRSKHVSDHFSNGYELDYWKDEVKKLQAENKRLRQALAERTCK